MFCLELLVHISFLDLVKPLLVDPFQSTPPFPAGYEYVTKLIVQLLEEDTISLDGLSFVSFSQIMGVGVLG